MFISCLLYNRLFQRSHISKMIKTGTRTDFGLSALLIKQSARGSLNYFIKFDKFTIQWYHFNSHLCNTFDFFPCFSLEGFSVAVRKFCETENSCSGLLENDTAEPNVDERNKQTSKLLRRAWITNYFSLIEPLLEVLPLRCFSCAAFDWVERIGG